jgi:galactokinase
MNPVAVAFSQLFNKEAQVVASAPGRVNLIGEHVDYSDGFVLPFAIICRTTVAIAKRNDRLIRIASQQRDGTIVEVAVSELMPGAGVDWARYPLGVVWTMGISSGLDVLIDGNVPLGAGLSSSAAIECSMAIALNELFHLGHSLETLAKLTQEGRERLRRYAFRNYGSERFTDGQSRLCSLIRLQRFIHAPHSL